MARYNGFVLGAVLVAITACAGARVAAPGVNEVDLPVSQLDRLRQDPSPGGRDALAKYLYQIVSDAWAPIPPGTSREALFAEGVNAAIAAARGAGDLNGWVGLAYWLQLPGSFDTSAAAGVACQESDAQPKVELIAEVCGDLLQRKGDLPGAMATWRRAISDSSKRADVMRVVNKVIQISLNPEQDLGGVSPILIAQARQTHEQQRQYDTCLASCTTMAVGCLSGSNQSQPVLGGSVWMVAASRGSSGNCGNLAGSCAYTCRSYLN